MSVDLYDPEAIVIVLIGKSSYAGALAGASVSEEQNVVGRPSLKKCFGVAGEFLFLHLISYQV